MPVGPPRDPRARTARFFYKGTARTLVRLWTGGIIALVPLLDGCVAVAYYHGRTVDLSQVMDQFPDEDVQNGRLTASTIESRWGAPDFRSTLGPNREEWKYRKDLRWEGALLFLLLPVPLMIPTGREHFEIQIENGIAVSATGTRQGGADCIYGVLPGPCTGFGARVHRF